LSKKRKRIATELLLSVATTGSFNICNVNLPTTNQRVVRDKVLSISPEYKTISENITKKLIEFKQNKKQQRLIDIENMKNRTKNINSMFNNALNKIK